MILHGVCVRGGLMMTSGLDRLRRMQKDWQ
jgi:hypothetical protein